MWRFSCGIFCFGSESEAVYLSLFIYIDYVFWKNRWKEIRMNLDYLLCVEFTLGNHVFSISLFSSIFKLFQLQIEYVIIFCCCCLLARLNELKYSRRILFYFLSYVCNTNFELYAFTFSSIAKTKSNLIIQ